MDEVDEDGVLAELGPLADVDPGELGPARSESELRAAAKRYLSKKGVHKDMVTKRNGSSRVPASRQPAVEPTEAQAQAADEREWASWAGSLDRSSVEKGEDRRSALVGDVGVLPVTIGRTGDGEGRLDVEGLPMASRRRDPLAKSSEEGRGESLAGFFARRFGRGPRTWRNGGS